MRKVYGHLCFYIVIIISSFIYSNVVSANELDQQIYRNVEENLTPVSIDQLPNDPLQEPDRVLYVNSLDDVADGACDLQHCSLREAILTANQLSGVTEIQFDIQYDADHSVADYAITPTLPLPVITQSVIIRGVAYDNEQADTGRISNIVIAGHLSPEASHGLVLEGAGSALIGITVTGFSGSGVLLSGGGRHVLLSNKILGNAGHGIEILTNENRVGGPEFLDGNIIESNQLAGISIARSSANIVAGNYFINNLIGAVVADQLTQRDTIISRNIFTSQGERFIVDPVEDQKDVITLSSEQVTPATLEFGHLINMPGGLYFELSLTGEPNRGYVVELLGDSQCHMPLSEETQNSLQAFVVHTDEYGVAQLQSYANSSTGITGVRALVHDDQGHGYDVTPCSPVLEQCDDELSCQAALSEQRSHTGKRLFVSVGGTGVGFVFDSSYYAGVFCPSICSATYPSYFSSTILQAVPLTGSMFSGWSGCDVPLGRSCIEFLSGFDFVSARFDRQQYPVRLTVNRSGSGRVTSSPSGISCGFDCRQDYLMGTFVRLTATPSSGYRFVGWTGACSGSSSSCTVYMSTARTVGAVFARQEHRVTVNRFGAGTVVAVPAGIVCGSDCDHVYTDGTVVTFTAIGSAADNSSFSHWRGACSGTSNTCTLVVRNPLSIDAVFEVTNRPPVAVNDSRVIDEDTSVNIDVLTNDSDPDGDSISLVSVSAPSHGNVFIQNGSVVYTPAANYFGEDQFSYTISDGRGGTASGLVSIVIQPVNDAPTAVCASLTLVADDQCLAYATASDVGAGSYDVDGDPISLSIQPGAPYVLGDNIVSLIVDDGQGETNSVASCSTVIRVDDHTPPTVTCPADITKVSLDDYLEVFYDSPTATDNCSTAIAVECDQPSGGFFAVGLNAVACSATDAASNTSSCGFAVDIKTPAEQVSLIDDMIADLVDSGAINNGQANALSSKLESVVDANNATSACGSLGAFANQLDALVNSGRLSAEEAAALLAAADLLSDAYACEA